jgi:RNA polymerase sigma-70 factor (ECF subfamily)
VGDGAVRIDRQKRFETMFRQYEHRLLGYALRRAPLAVAQDAVADAFLVAWRRFDELPDDPLPWLVATTRRTLANQRRAASRQDRLAQRLVAPNGTLDDTAAAAQDTGGVGAALRRLSPIDREALALVAWEGLTPTQAARSLGCSQTAFRVRLHRARRRFETALERERRRGHSSGWSERASAKEAS